MITRISYHPSPYKVTKMFSYDDNFQDLLKSDMWYNIIDYMQCDKKYDECFN